MRKKLFQHLFYRLQKKYLIFALLQMNCNLRPIYNVLHTSPATLSPKEFTYLTKNKLMSTP